MREPDLKKLRQDTQSWRPNRRSGGAFWWIIGAFVVLWLLNGGPR